MLDKSKYKHSISEKLFIQALTATDDEFERGRELYHENGIVRASWGEILKEMPFLFWYGLSGEKVTFIYDAEIKRDLEKDGIKLLSINSLNLRPLLLYNCYTHSILISDCNLAKEDKVKIEGFDLYLINTMSESLMINNSTLGNIKAREFKTNDMAVNASLLWDLKFDKSHLNNFAFNKSRIWNLNFDFESEVGRLSVQETNVNGLYFRKSKSHDINVFKESNLNSIYVQSSKIDEFSIQNKTTSETVNIGFKSIIGEVYISSEVNIKSLGINNSSIELIELRKDIEINSISCRNSTLNYFKAENLSCQFYFGNLKGVEVKIENCDSNKLSIKDCHTDFYVKSGNINILNLTNSLIPQAQIISISNVNVYSVLLENLIVSGKLMFIKICVLSAPFIGDESTLYDEKELNNHSIQRSTFRIAFSSLGDTEFIDSDLSGFEKFEFSNSRITHSFFTGGTQPSHNICIYETDERSEIWYEQMVSLFNQLSINFQSQGHIYQFVDYKSKSASYKHEHLKSRKNQDGNWLDRFPFFWNKLSNDYGANWFRAFGFILWTSILLYLLTLLSTGNLLQFNSKFEWAYVGHYFDFINPLRPFDFYFQIGICPNGVTRFLDVLSRVVIGYGIYQLITAFRKYGRK